jgi:hypothetical protein
MSNIFFNLFSFLLFTAFFEKFLVSSKNTSQIWEESLEIKTKIGTSFTFSNGTALKFQEKCIVFYLKMNYSLIDYTLNDNIESNTLLIFNSKNGKFLFLFSACDGYYRKKIQI